ncbi:phospholipid/cholesterol/gamma-HCH transport system permease protein [Methylopila jiangsuensis]|uniref:MlaE family lipid ABC transporter permease subunit n=1 Tax=Methylopila jiangsuensis TaxID=586230 RepID=UPI0022F2B9CA|nr:MlaE family lipid ABC transporter permease subunit [Methylopila jiangsuensis]MDR6286069.1 phospholipid/cholesterol/gamma-HCH transport system permease protein [Methylopila jiangsuensis]
MQAEAKSGSFKTERVDDGVVLKPLGDWTASAGEPLARQVDRADLRDAQGKTLVIDLSDLGRLDTVGAVLIRRLVEQAEAAGAKARLQGASAQHERLLDALDGRGQEPAPTGPKESAIFATLADFGAGVVSLKDDVVLGVSFLGAVTMASLRLLRAPWRFRFTSTVANLQRVGLAATPIVALISFLVGAIVAQQSIFQLKNFGATLFVVDLLGILVLRELGVLLTAIMVAGRSGSAFTAEIGSMKMREEIDALKTMGLDPIEILAMPRLVALVIAMPLLSFLASMSALLGGGLVAWLYGDITPITFLQRLKDALTFQTFMVGIVKAPFMAVVIGLIACTEGAKVQGSAESLGARTTSSVVKSIFVVIVLDGVFAMLFASMGI